MNTRILVGATMAAVLLSTSAFAFPVLPPMTAGNVAPASPPASGPAFGAIMSPIAGHPIRVPARQLAEIEQIHRELSTQKASSLPVHPTRVATAEKAAGCASLEARFEGTLRPPAAHRGERMTDAIALFREGAAFCGQGNLHAGMIYLKGALNTLLGHHVV